jgi:lipoprotein-anchoring transpeptidase ErfK/SrfK
MEAPNWRTRSRIAAALACAAAIAGVGVAVLLTGNTGTPSRAPSALGKGGHASQGRTAPHGVAASDPGVTVLAALHGATARYSSPNGSRTGWVPGSWYGAQSVLPVIGSQPGWVRVRLAQRPNGSTAWIQDKNVQLQSTSYRIAVDLATRHLTLYSYDQPVFSVPAGVGTVTDPTPAGQYFVAFFEAPPTSAYGAFVIVTSAHSEAISNWEGSGDAVIGIHGPLGGSQLIGTNGANISHGCIRLQEAALLRLRDIPAGTPIDISD